MKCGEFDKRNAEFEKIFSSEKYFSNLIYESISDYNSKKGEGKNIFDVGAHKGESAKFFNKIFPKATIYSFEPIPFAANNIIDLKIPNVYLSEIALSDFNGDSDFNIQDISHLSSLNKINRKSNQSMGYAAKETHKKIKVKVSRGDSFVLNNKIDTIDILKIDVQANEVKTIKGFSKVLNKIKAIIVEVSFYDFYENRSIIREIEESIPNFDFFDIYEISKNPKTLGTDWATFVYKQKQK
jgi:FkbM family methyltransferase